MKIHLTTKTGGLIQMNKHGIFSYVQKKERRGGGGITLDSPQPMFFHHERFPFGPKTRFIEVTENNLVKDSIKLLQATNNNANRFIPIGEKSFALRFNSTLFTYIDGTQKKLEKSAEYPIINLEYLDDQLWVSYHGNGAIRFDSDLKETAQVYSEHSITSICKDDTEGYWFTTLENGIFYSKSLDVQNVLHDGIKESENIQYMANGDCHTLASTREGKLILLKGDSIVWESDLFLQKSFSGVFFQPKANHFLIWCQSGGYALNPTTKELRKVKNLAPTNQTFENGNI